MENSYQIGDIRRRNQVGLKGKQKVRWSKCTSCGIEKWAMVPVKEDYLCVSCNSRKWMKEANIVLNNAPHKIDCKCHRCRIGKGYFKGANNPMWNGGEQKLKSGYIYSWVSDNSPYRCMCAAINNRRNYVAKHRLIMAEHIGRPLLRSETVHHINGIRDDNRIENLELWSSSHQSGQRIDDQIKWAIELLKTHNYTIKKNKHNEKRISNDK